MNTLPHSPTPDSDASDIAARPTSARAAAPAIAAAAAVVGLAVAGVTLGSNLASAAGDEPQPDRTDTPAPEPIDDTSVVVLGESKIDEMFAAYDDCLSAALPDLFAVGETTEMGEIAAMEIPDSVALYANNDVSFYDFGDGDGEITLTKTNGAITVAVDGDVIEFDDSSFDMAEFDAEFEPEFGPEFDAEFDAAHEGCADLLPDDIVVEPAVEVTDADTIDG
ncbi:MAG: hypothetical protein AB8G26_06030 [Ilumatobacter sp.]